jgi:hypothetical protein
MSAIPPLAFRWDGEALFPLRPVLADKHFVAGETYCMVEHHTRSMNSHRHYFSAINDLWQTLPDHLLEEYPTSEKLRKTALIRKGYHTCQDHVCGSKAEAQRLRAFVAAMDEYAIVIAKDAVVRVYRAMSQSQKAMGARDFQASKQAVLDFIEDLIGAERGTAERSAA